MTSLPCKYCPCMAYVWYLAVKMQAFLTPALALWASAKLTPSLRHIASFDMLVRELSSNSVMICLELVLYCVKQGVLVRRWPWLL